jgi:hypothetical protein
MLPGIVGTHAALVSHCEVDHFHELAFKNYIFISPAII